MIRQIVQYPDPMLRKLCLPVLEMSDETSALVADMFETMYAAYGRGLAAPQVGQPVRVFVMDATWKQGARSPMVFINPEILAASPEVQTNEEACLSIPDCTVSVARPKWVDVMWMDLSGAQNRGRFEGFEAACITHERDHLDGRLIVDFEGAA